MRQPAAAPSPGFTLVESLVALCLLALAALISLSSSAWTARMLARAEAREDAATAAGTLIDSLADSPAGGGALERNGLKLEWRAEMEGRVARLHVRVTAPGRPAQIRELFGTLRAPPPPSLERP